MQWQHPRALPPSRITAALLLLSTAATAAAQTTTSVLTSTWTDADGNHLWSDQQHVTDNQPYSGNWSTPYFPSNGNGDANGTHYEYNVVINGNAPTQLNVPGVAVDSLTLGTADATLDLLSGTALTLAAPGTLTNNGTILVHSDAGNNDSGVIFAADTTLAGTGTLRLNTYGLASTLQTFGSVPLLTQSAGHTIAGQGRIVARLVNNGTISADVPGGTLGAGANSLGTLFLNNGSDAAVTLTNNATAQATNGGFLALGGITVNQAPGAELLADAGTVVFYAINGATTVAGGSIGARNGGSVVLYDGVTTFDAVTNNAPLTVGNAGLYVQNGLVDNGSITVGSYTHGILRFTDGSALSGTGTLSLTDPDSHLQGSLTQAAGHTIQGRGFIDATLTNNGTLAANVSGAPLTVFGTLTNNGLVSATNGGTLVLPANGTVLANYDRTAGSLTGGAYLVADASTIDAGTAAITTSAADVTLAGPTSSFAALAPLAANSGAFRLRQNRPFTTQSSLTNTGTLDLASGSSLTVTGNLDGDTGTLSVDASTLTASRLRQSSLAVSNSGSVHLRPTSAGGSPSALSSLTLTTNGTLDLADNPLSITATGSPPITPPSTIRQYLHDSLLISSTASADPQHLRALGYLLNPNTNTLTIKTTLMGDANLDGKVDADDYVLLDKSFAQHLPDAYWWNGDFNYDGVINASDYLLIDTTFGQAQGFSPGFLSQRESQFGEAYISTLLTSVPEPTSPIACLVATLLLPPRRRRYH